ncbi:MAG TPA: bacteriohopanetetrol glucosamine biosynthesis glycosyltransferase HpnI [Dongiaceae bacterium]|nr:bacteriohopanetetrol glucosamine biosynthesis glycosyltransferase HpnI [Dongiaceae bacterium]
MIQNTLRILQWLCALGCISSSIYYLCCLRAAAAFLAMRKENDRSTRTHSLPPVSLLKPLKGTDPEIYESFRSHCLQDYPEYEIIFGVSDAADPAVVSVEQLRREFPDQTIHLVVCPEILGPNVKVSNLEQMVRVARYEYQVVNDSDIRVQSDYLKKVVTPLQNEKVGLVTCLYRGVAADSLGSRVESLGISTDFCPSVLVARLLEKGLSFGLGSTLAFRRTELREIGGFSAIIDFLADDYELGRRIAKLGLEVVLSDTIVQTYLPPYRFRDFVAHQIRWARGVRDARLAGYIGLASTFGLFWSLLNLGVARGVPWAWGVFGLVLVLRFLVALGVGKKVLRDRQVLPNLWLLPVRDLIAVAVWITSFFGHTVTWRGDRFQLRNGRLIRIRS